MNRTDLDIGAYEAEAASAKRRIAETVGTIQHRLNPKTIANQAMDAAVERGVAAARSAKEAVVDHAVGVAAIGVGVGLLFGAGQYYKHRRTEIMTEYDDEYRDPVANGRMERLRESAGQARQRAGERVSAARAAASERLASARERSAETWETARTRAGEYAERTRDGARRARERTAEGVDHNPLTAALIGAAVGAVIGALLPATRRENRAFGPTRDRLAENARTAALAARDAARQRFDELGVKDQAKSEFERIKDSASDIARSATDAARASQKRGSDPLQ
jgi:ElaB/YqjD/DUF883 family membrane-anchored ribosome-binding protein